MEFPSSIVKAAINVVSRPLSRVFNRCIVLGYFPSLLKVAKIIPIFKSNYPTKPTNYRLISILKTFSKIFEKHIYNELLSFVTKYNILSNDQFGFRKNVSTGVAIASFLRKVLGGANEGCYGAGVFLDLQKAFDSVSHDILLYKLSHYGVRGKPFELISSYLKDRKQYVQLRNVKSGVVSLNLGTPQGAILSPLLFLIFINDIVNSSQILKFTLFADDTSLYLKDSSIHNLLQILNIELKKIERWILANRLSLNVSKTVYLLFCGKKECSPDMYSLSMFNRRIEQKSVTKFLGVFIDDKLSWKPHAQFVLGKLSRMAGILHQTKDCLTKTALKTIYYSLVYPNIQYGIIFWGATCKTLLDKIFVLQKRILRTVDKVSFLHHTGEIFHKLKILKIVDILKMESVKFIHKDLKCLNFFDFSPRESVHSYNTRSRSSLDLPAPRMLPFYNSFCYTGIKTYNELPEEMKSLDSVEKFKARVKDLLVNGYGA